MNIQLFQKTILGNRSVRGAWSLGVVLAVLAVGLALFAGSPSVAYADTCNARVDLSASPVVLDSSTQKGHGTFTNNSATCSYHVWIASYEIYDKFGTPNYLKTQKLYNSQHALLQPGKSVTLYADLPSCNHQVDLFQGSYAPQSNPDFAVLQQQGTHWLFTWNGNHTLGLCGVTQQPITADIKANGSDGPITIGYNTSANISWTSQNASSCTVTPGNWTGTSGSRSSGNLVSSRTYHLNCTGSNGSSASDSVTVNVQNQPSPPPTADIKANGSDGPITIPGTIAGAPSGELSFFGKIVSAIIPSAQAAPGAQATLTWTSTNATSCTVNPGSFSGTSGNRVVTVPSPSQTYTIFCTGPGGSASDSVTVNVTSQPQPITADIKANGSDGPITIEHNTSANISWTSQNANSCTVSPGGWTGTSGSQSSGNLTFTQTYTVNCTGNNGSASDSVSVQVNQQNLPTVDLTASPRTITQGQTAVLSWTSQNANSCSASVGWSGSKSTFGSETAAPSFTTTYTITCVNQYGLAQDTDTITVIGAPPTNVNIQMTKTALNRTQGQTTFTSFTTGQGSDTLEFEIRVRNLDFTNGGTVTVRDILPPELAYVPGSTRIDGAFAPDGITSGGISIGFLAGGQEKVIRLQATVLPGTTVRTITNQAFGTVSNGTSQSAVTTVQIQGGGQVLGAADIVTGPENMVPWALLMGLLGSSMSYYFFFRRNEEEAGLTLEFATLPAIGLKPARAFSSENESEFDKLATRLRAEEKKPDTDKYGKYL